MRIEMHIHTSEVSPCAQCTAAEAVHRCLSKGFDAMAVTNHFSEDAARRFGDPANWPARVENFLRGYEAAKAVAPPGFLVLLGMELRFTGPGANDYLVYGFDEAFLYANEGFDRLGMKKFSALARENGLLVAQAHPFRWGMMLTRAEWLDGLEVYNGHANHPAHNEFAALWARKFGLLPLSGSDYHGGDTGDGVAPGGIRLREPIRNERELVKAIKERRYTLL
ncbi:MAG: PHP domain-containing protein [Firmicutes bacterium]|nr:PHP domain-containing protein [Bacillota bacterium]